jgi:hypothetical protein
MRSITIEKVKDTIRAGLQRFADLLQKHGYLNLEKQLDNICCVGGSSATSAPDYG